MTPVPVPVVMVTRVHSVAACMVGPRAVIETVHNTAPLLCMRCPAPAERKNREERTTPFYVGWDSTEVREHSGSPSVVGLYLFALLN